jgi:hypothetical protein
MSPELKSFFSFLVVTSIVYVMVSMPRSCHPLSKNTGVHPFRG